MRSTPGLLGAEGTGFVTFSGQKLSKIILLTSNFDSQCPENEVETIAVTD